MKKEFYEKEIDFLSDTDFTEVGVLSKEVLEMSSESSVYDQVISDTERKLIEKALKRSFGNQSIASKLLGISRNTLRIKIKKLKIDVAGFKI